MTRAIERAVFWIMCAAMGAAPAMGQAPLLRAPIDSGALVRMYLTTGASTRGRLLARFAPDSQRIVFCHYPRTPCQSRSEPAARSLPVEAIRRLEIGRGTRARGGALIGALVGAVLLNAGARFANGLCETRCANPTVYTFGGAIGGGLWGALLGSSVTIWDAAP